MNRTPAVSRALTGLLWLTNLVLGFVFSAGHGLNLVPLHMTIGTLFLLALWTFALQSVRAGAPRGPAIALILLGALVPALGLAHMRPVGGEYQWIVRVVHPLVAILTMPLVATLSMGGR